MNAELAAHADLQLQAMALVQAVRDDHAADREYLTAQCDPADLITGLVLFASKLTCTLASAWGMTPDTLHATLRQIFAEQAAG